MDPIVVMGVAGCGKTTVGRLLAERLGVPHAEADDLHPPSSLAKMAHGVALTDADREPWLAAVADLIAAAAGGGLVVSCSALRRRYRDRLRGADPRTWFLHLVIDERTAFERVAGRSGHFLPPSLVASQFATLEPLRGERGVAVDGTRPPERIIATALDADVSPA